MVVILPDQVYAEPDGFALRFDLFRPESSVPAPLVICVHGGGWISGSKEDMREVALGLAAKGFAAACPNYRLAPLNPYPAAVEDIHSFVKAARENAAEWRIDPERMASLGNSAGGHLAAMAGLTGLRENRVNAVVDISGISDLTVPREKHFAISWAFLEEFMGCQYEGNEAAYREASPITHVDSNSPPFLVIHGENDDIVPVEQSRELCRALADSGVRHTSEYLPNEMHSYSFLGWQRVEELYARFLTDQFSHALL